MRAGKTLTIAGTGCALVDYLYKPVNFNDPILNRYFSKIPGDGGLAPGKLVFKEEFENYSGEPYTQVREKLTKGMRPVGMNIGGPSIVALIHAAQMLQDLPVDVRFYGCRGVDEGGAYIEEKLKHTPLEIATYKTSRQFTPFTDVFSDPDYDSGSGERIFVNNIGAAWDLLPSDLDIRFFQSDLVIFGGTALVPYIHGSLRELLEKAKDQNAITVVNTVFDFISERQDPSKPWSLGESAATYRYIDLLITDMEESLRLSGCNSVEAAIGFFKSAGIGSVIITHGANEVHYYAGNELFGQVPYTKVPVSAKVKAELRENIHKTGDTTGCGDNFTGGVIASLAKQLVSQRGFPLNMPEAVSWGVASGGYTCFYNGGTWYEEFPGQKLQLISPYLQAYLKQTGIHVEKDGNE